MSKNRKIVDIIKTLKRAPPDNELQSTTLFNSVDIDDYRLSIQASKDHHCTPKINNLDATQYTHFEVALYFKKPPSRFLKHRIYKNLQTWLDYEDDLMLFAQMPHDKVNELYDILKTQKVLKLIAKSVPINLAEELFFEMAAKEFVVLHERYGIEWSHNILNIVKTMINHPEKIKITITGV